MKNDDGGGQAPSWRIIKLPLEAWTPQVRKIMVGAIVVVVVVVVVVVMTVVVIE